MGGTKRLDSTSIGSSSSDFSVNSGPLNMSRFGDLSSSIGQDFFGVDPDAGSDDEEKLIRDGNDQVLKNFEVRKKDREYSRSQPSRGTKHSAMTMAGVDWSGFPGAAHVRSRPRGETSGRQHRRSSLTDSNTERRMEHRAALHRAQRRMSADAAEPLASPPESPLTSSSRRLSPSRLSPRISPSMSPNQRRNRRQLKTNGHMSTQSFDGIRSRSSLENGDSHPRGERSASANQSRPQRRRLQRTSKNSSSRELSQAGTSKRGKSPGSRVQRRQVSPSERARRSSPSQRLRRSCQAAASSTLEVSEVRKKRSSSGSRGSRRQPSRRGLGLEHDGEQLLQKAKSLRW